MLVGFFFCLEVRVGSFVCIRCTRKGRYVCTLARNGSLFLAHSGPCSVIIGLDLMKKFDISSDGGGAGDWRREKQNEEVVWRRRDERFSRMEEVMMSE